MTADTSSRFTLPTDSAKNLVIADPERAPTLAPAVMKAKSRLPCSLSNRSAMKLQNTEITNRLKTLTQTKNTRAVAASSSCAVKTAQNATSCAAKKTYVHGRNTPRRKRPLSQPKTGTASSMPSSVQPKRSSMFSTPPVTPMLSRIGRRM